MHIHPCGHEGRRRGRWRPPSLRRTVTLAATVTLFAGMTTALAPAASGEGSVGTGSISGTVTGLQNQEHHISAFACPASVSLNESGVADCAPAVDLTFSPDDLTTGSFTINNLLPGQYIVQVEATSIDGSSAPEPIITAQFQPDVDVEAGTTTDAGSLTASYGGQIHARVTDDNTAQPISGICMSASSDGVVIHDTPACSNETGDYWTAGLPAGTYALDLWDPQGNYLDRTVGGIEVSGTGTAEAAVALAKTASAVLSGTVEPAIAGVYVAAYFWPEGTALNTSDIGPADITTTDSSGAYALHLSPGTYALVFTKPGFMPTFLGGETSVPMTATETNSVTIVDGSQSVPAVTLAPQVIGSHAVNDLSYCYANSVAPNDDDSSAEITLPFTVDFYGTVSNSVYVNNNGNVTIGQPLSQYTPDDLTTGGHVPMIAPFFADVDTRGLESQVVSYGVSPDGKTFCTDWVHVGYYSSATDKLDSFQLLLTTRSGTTGRSDGDFDATFNYDQIQWESGDASGGEGGLGGTSAAVGYTAGTGESGTYFQFEGSLEPGDFLDGGSHALTAGHLNSTVPGRYLFQIRNAESQIHLGSMTGSAAFASDNSPAGGAAVQACPTVGNRCFYTATSATGEWSIPGVPVGDYFILVNPPSDSEGVRAGSGSATVTEGTTTAVDAIQLGQLQVPALTTTFGNENADLTQPTIGGVPSVYWDDPTVLSVSHETGHTGTFSVTFTDGSDPVTGPMAEEPSGSGTYVATIPSFYPAHGEAHISVTFDGSTEPTEQFDIYIDPSGIVTDLSGNPISGAKVTLERADSQDGPFNAVPDGAAIMSLSNRTNPWITGASGRFSWDVIAGWYRLSVSADGFTASVTDAFEVPPPQTDLVIKLRPESTGQGTTSPGTTSSTTPVTGTASSTDRIAGSNRYATAAALATQFGTANAIVVANGTDAKDGADALAANYLAGKVEAPIVLAQASRVEAETLAAVKAVLKGAANPTIYVMGGGDSVSNAVANQIKAAAATVSTGTVTVKRVGGSDRYATAALAATTAGSVTNSLALYTTGKAATTAILASGEVNADALAAGALSNAWGIPVLLTRAGQLPKPVQEAITSGKITQLIVLGGTDRVSQAVLDQAKTAGVTSTKRIAGTDRFDTSAQLYTFAMGTLSNDSGKHYGTDGATVFLANGVTGFADALAVGPLAGKNGSALLTVRPNALGAPATAFLKAHADAIDSVTGLGSTSTIIAAVLAQADGLV